MAITMMAEMYIILFVKNIIFYTIYYVLYHIIKYVILKIIINFKCHVTILENIVNTPLNFKIFQIHL